jgi:hypothetical protein
MQIDAQENRLIKNEKRGLLFRFLRPSQAINKVETVSEEDSFEAYELMESIKSARHEWANANMSFEYANEKEMVDYYTYKIKACEVRYEYLIRKAKEKGIRADLLESNNIVTNLDEAQF